MLEKEAAMQLDLSQPEVSDAMQHYLNGDWTNASASVQKLMEANPDNHYYPLILGNIMYSMGELDRSAELYEKAIEIKPDLGIAYYKLGVCYYRSGKLEQGLDAFQKILELKDQSHAMASYFVGLINHLLGNDAAAEKGFSILHEKSPESLIANYYLAQLKLKENKYREALDLLEDLVKVAPSLAEVHYLIGTAKLRLHENFEAIKCFRRTLELNPNDSRAKSALELLLNVQEP